MQLDIISAKMLNIYAIKYNNNESKRIKNR